MDRKLGMDGLDSYPEKPQHPVSSVRVLYKAGQEGRVIVNS